MRKRGAGSSSTTRRRFSLAVGGAVLSSISITKPARAAEWPSASPAEAGLKDDLRERLDAAFAKGTLKGLHSVLVVRGKTLAFERYYAGNDWSWGTPLGTIQFGPDTLHDVRSVSKSIVSLLYGIALADGKVPPADATLVEQFPQYADLIADPARRKITIGHALSMTLGLEWNEDIPYTDPRNGEHQMEMAKDRYRFILERPIVAEPGSRWTYNGGATAVIGHLISRGTGMGLHDYARKALFEPLGIAPSEWIKGSNGEDAAASGLRLRPRDMAKIGRLVLDRGNWGKMQIVPGEWLEASFKPYGSIEPYVNYGYFWWLIEFKHTDGPAIVAVGNGGQRIYAFRDLDLVIAVTAGIYNTPNQYRLPNRIVSEFVLPSLTR
jgi:CubicO group peptidase (beta-lactamase class C family)